MRTTVNRFALAFITLSLTCVFASQVFAEPRSRPAFSRAAELAKMVGVRPSLAMSVVGWESGGNYRAKASTTSASGPMQVIDRTASDIAGRHVSRHERMSDTGLKLGVAYLAACQEAMPRSNDRATWRRCFVAGHGNVGAHISTAKRAFARMASR